MKLSEIKKKINNLIVGLNAEQAWQTLSLVKDVLLEDPFMNDSLKEKDEGDETLLEIELGEETRKKAEEILEAVNEKNFKAVQDYINICIEQYSQECRLPKKIIENLELSDEQLTKVKKCYQTNQHNGAKFSSFLDELLSESSKLLKKEQEFLLANLYPLEKRSRPKVKKIVENQAVDVTTVSDPDFEADLKKTSHKRLRKSSFKKPSNIDDVLWQRICVQLVAAKKEFFKATTFDSTNTPEIRRVEIREDKPVLQHVMKIKPDALCGADENKRLDFLQTIIEILKDPKLFNCTSPTNIILVKKGMKLEEEWNKHYRTNKQGKRFFVGYALSPEEYNNNIGSLILKGATAVRVAKKIDQWLSKVELQADSKQEEISLDEKKLEQNSSYGMLINTLLIGADNYSLENKDEHPSSNVENKDVSKENSPQPLENEDSKLDDSDGVDLT